MDTLTKLSRQVKAVVILVAVLATVAAVAVYGSGDPHDSRTQRRERDIIKMAVDYEDFRSADILITVWLDGQQQPAIHWRGQIGWRQTYTVRKGKSATLQALQSERGKLYCRLWVNDSTDPRYAERYERGAVTCRR